MKNVYENIAFGFFFLPILSSCGITYPVNHYLYAPTSSIIFLHKKNDVQATGQVILSSQDPNSNSEVPGIGVRAGIGYALTNHFAIFANGTYLSEKEKYNTEDKIRHQRFAFNAGAGYFTNITNRLKFLMSVGYGRGNLNIKSENDFYRNKNERFFLSPALRLSLRERLHLSLTTETTFVTFLNASTSYDEYYISNYQLFLGKSNCVFLEPQIAIQFPLSRNKKINGFGQLAPVFQLSGPKIHYRKYQLGIGITANLNQ